MSARALLTRVLLEKSAVLAVAALACAIAQYIFLRQSDLDNPLAIWRLPTGSNGNFCVSNACGGASILLMFGGPAVGIACSLLYDTINHVRLSTLGKSRLIERLDDPFLRLQFAIVIVIILANGMLGGSLLTAIAGEVRGLAPILVMQTCLVAMAYLSATTATLSGYARKS
jgi:hypothetical protein